MQLCSLNGIDQSFPRFSLLGLSIRDSCHKSRPFSINFIIRGNRRRKILWMHLPARNMQLDGSGLVARMRARWEAHYWKRVGTIFPSQRRPTSSFRIPIFKGEDERPNIFPRPSAQAYQSFPSGMQLPAFLFSFPEKFLNLVQLPFLWKRL